jgi:phosphotransferase system  glucose/maltose/N-acetylglucosamine-specific IIC component
MPHLAAVPDEPDQPAAVDLDHLTALVLAQLQANPGALVPVRQPDAPAPARPYGQYLALAAGGAAVLLPVLLATTAALIAAGTGALALAVAALVIRWIIRDMRRG